MRRGGIQILNHAGPVQNCIGKRNGIRLFALEENIGECLSGWGGDILILNLSCTL